MKIQITYKMACEFVAWLGAPVLSQRRSLNILCLQGASPLPAFDGLIQLNNNSPDKYNDCMILFWKDSHGQHVKALKATTQPGRFYTQVKPNPLGAANLVWGVHPYKKGRRRGRVILVSATGFDRVWRDANGDFRQNLDELLYLGRFGIQVHAGGHQESVGRWSAGCIAIHGGYDGQPYSLFLKKLKEHSAKIVYLSLWGAADFSRWVVCKSNWEPCLRLGIQSHWVAQMQNLLSLGSETKLIADGIWGQRTQKAFLDFQSQAGLALDGICGPISWRVLNEKRQATEDNFVEPNKGVKDVN